ncbi:MAG: siphovirus Gp157 family protein [Rhizomicrobium sp.]
MQASSVLSTEINNYLILAEQLKAQYADLDEDTLADTLEGITQLPDLITQIVRSGLEDEVLFNALKQRMEEMQARLTRLKERHDKKRAMAAWAMSHAQIPRVQAPDFSLSLRPGSQRLEIQNEALVPPLFFVPQPPRLDRAGLSSCLKRGETVAGAVLVQGEPTIQVRVR